MIFAGLAAALKIAPLVIFLIVTVIYSAWNSKRLVARLSAPQHRKLLVHNFSLTKLVIRTFCMVAALLALWFAVLRIQYESQEKLPAYEQGRDVVIALDISRSMLAQDYQPNRLVFAKQKIKQLLQQLTSERVGLIVFSGSALVQCPLTKDFEAFELFLDAIDAESMTHGTTDIGSALQAACTLFEQQPERKNKLLVVFTDGEDFSVDLAAMQKQAEDCHMRVCAIGMATPAGAPIPLYAEDGTLQGHIRDDAGNVVMSRLQEKTLKTLATQLGGIYVRAQDADDDIAQLRTWVARFDTEQFAATDRVKHEETFMYYAATALFLLLVSRCV